MNVSSHAHVITVLFGEVPVRDFCSFLIGLFCLSVLLLLSFAFFWMAICLSFIFTAFYKLLAF